MFLGDLISYTIASNDVGVMFGVIFSYDQSKMCVSNLDLLKLENTLRGIVRLVITFKYLVYD